MSDIIKNHLGKSSAALAQIAGDDVFTAKLNAIAGVITEALKSGNKLLLVGNGGSAADAQHIAAEIIGRYKRERPAYAALALTTDTSALTAIGNDFGFEQVFSRQLRGLGKRGDVLLALSTSGRSPNILHVLETARDMGIVTIGFTGSKGEPMRAACTHAFVIPTDDTPIIQQIYMTAAHAICDEVEYVLAGRPV